MFGIEVLESFYKLDKRLSIASPAIITSTITEAGNTEMRSTPLKPAQSCVPRGRPPAAASDRVQTTTSSAATFIFLCLNVLCFLVRERKDNEVETVAEAEKSLMLFSSLF